MGKRGQEKGEDTPKQLRKDLMRQYQQAKSAPKHPHPRGPRHKSTDWRADRHDEDEDQQQQQQQQQQGHGHRGPHGQHGRQQTYAPQPVPPGSSHHKHHEGGHHAAKSSPRRPRHEGKPQGKHGKASPRTPRSQRSAGHAQRSDAPRWRSERDGGDDTKGSPRTPRSRGNRSNRGHGGNNGSTSRPNSSRSNRSTPSRGRNIFEPYLSPAEVEKRAARGELVIGRLRVNPKNYEDCYVKHSAHYKRDISVPTMTARNRALDGDEVAVELLPRYCWRVMETEAERAAERTVKAGIPRRQQLSPLRATRRAAADDDDVDGVTQQMSELKASEQRNGRANWTDYDDDDEEVEAVVEEKEQGSNDDDEDEEEEVKDLDDIDTDAVEKKGHEEDLSGPFMGPIEHRNDNIPDEFLLPIGRVRTHQAMCYKYVRFNPRDPRVPRLLIPKDKAPQDFYQNTKAYAGKCYTARLVHWSEHSPLAIGELVDVLGNAGAITVETESILQENGVPPAEFTEDVLACLPDVKEGDDWRIPQEELARRRDLRHERIFSVDPLTARDLDDALSCKKLDDGSFEVGVHIADVSFFIERGSALDKEAKRRATSTYMVHGVYPMLPRLLCENLCSLVADVDRLAYSVIWRLDADGNKLDQWMGRTVIRSCGKLAYEHAQAVIEDESVQWTGEDFPPISAPHTIDSVKRDIVHLDRLAKAMRRRRFAGGALSLNKGKVGIRVDPDTQEPVEVYPYEIRDANRMIEDFMLLANMSVAQVISDTYPQCALLRRHPPPLQARLHTVRVVLCCVVLCCVTVLLASHLTTHLPNQPNHQPCTQPSLLQVHALAAMLARAMQLAEYFSTGSEELTRQEWRHYALNAPVYTHFTSPIRRYADVIVHRLLTSALNGDIDPHYGHPQVDDIADTCNVRKLAAKRAQESSVSLYTSAYLAAHGPVVAQAVVIEVMSYSVKLHVPKYGIEHQANLKLLDLPLKYDERAGKLTVTWNDTTKQELMLFSHVNVQLTSHFKKQKYFDNVRILPPPK
ncbi:hypothetical protein PTSG_02410 [Salpingoeca rosetta]|uniref:RNB domain-containing protein n=1 Tax=Salpingoeca rosetta (strain ATCC 50818 / BSB-021) TaxID=946362 RepID=F2U245_SALR5|nr:uncharacterized protein PTSG_02410 [Salpingoeca rosetta]EGD81697.1 hypothetical protein PTSG_02410 [Salpingoeca rosetta]|eukprot:XP_004996901.1 hypothetical protein PTSG_02410 [Salpingoeca rosetta]